LIRHRAFLVLALATAAALGALVPVASGARGSAGLGDPYFPKAGNGGYDVRSYVADFDYAPATTPAP
jgi:hypothetical protein